MSKSETPKTKRILLKLSGEALMGDNAFGISRDTLKSIVGEIKEVVDLGVQLAIVVGGGNSAFDEGLYLLNLGVAELTVVEIMDRYFAAQAAQDALFGDPRVKGFNCTKVSDVEVAHSVGGGIDPPPSSKTRGPANVHPCPWTASSCSSGSRRTTNGSRT